jgi:hypothetical protein
MFAELRGQGRVFTGLRVMPWFRIPGLFQGLHRGTTAPSVPPITKHAGKRAQCRGTDINPNARGIEQETEVSRLEWSDV